MHAVVVDLFRFQRVELGDQPPRIEGVTVDGVGTNKVVMDLDIVYHGDARVQISVMKVSAGVSDLKLKGKLRFVMNLVDELPLIGSVEVMFLQPPELDFDLEGAANFLDLPGLSGMLRQVVTETLKSQMVYPNRISVITSDSVPPEKMLLPKPVGVLVLDILEAKNLPQTDFGGFLQIDPYCIIQFGSTSKKTKKASGSHPVWNEVFKFPIAIAERQTVGIDIYDSDSLSEDEFLGHVVVDVETAQKSKIQDLWIDLDNAGKFHIKTTWYEISDKLDQNTLSSKVLSLFVGTVSVSPNKSYDYRQIQVKLELENNSLSSKLVGKTVECEKFTVNEGFMTMLDENTKEFTVKVIDTEEDVKLGQITFNVKDLYQLENFEEPFGSFNIGNEKVMIEAHFSYFTFFLFEGWCQH